MTFVISESGWVVMTAGCILLGAALLTFARAAVSVPGWVRWSTVVAGIAAIASAAWFPLALLILWALAIGIWLLVTRPVTSAAQATA